VNNAISWKKLRFTFLLFCCLVLSSCSVGGAFSNKTAAYERLDASIAEEGFQAGIDSITETQRGRSPLYENNNAVSLYLDKGFLEHYAGDYQASATSLQYAERLIEEAYTKSITEAAASFILNDNTKEYAGEDFEDIYLSVFNALNYYNLGNIEGALVEVRKLTLPSGKLDMIERKHETVNAKATTAAEIPEGITIPQGENVVFTNSALARYLSILFYLAENNQDAARIETQQLRLAYATQPSIYGTNLPSSVSNLEKTDNNTRLDIICFTGMSPIKREKEEHLFLPIFSSQILNNIEFKLPELVNRPDRIDRIEIEVDDQTFNLELLEDMGAVIRDTFKASYNSIVTKTYIRTFSKYLVLDIANRIRLENNEKKDGKEKTFDSILRSSALIAGKAAFDATERADIRMARFLPNKAYVGSCFIAPGSYNITVNYYSNEVVQRSEVKENYIITANDINLLQLVNLGFNRRGRNRE